MLCCAWKTSRMITSGRATSVHQMEILESCAPTASSSLCRRPPLAVGLPASPPPPSLKSLGAEPLPTVENRRGVLRLLPRVRGDEAGAVGGPVQPAEEGVPRGLAEGRRDALHLLPVVHAPDAQRAVVRLRGEELADRIPGHALHQRGVPAQHAQLCAPVARPHHHVVVHAAAGQHGVARGPGHVHHVALVAFQGQHVLPVLHVGRLAAEAPPVRGLQAALELVQQHQPVVTGGGQRRAVAAPAHAVHGAQVVGERGEQLGVLLVRLRLAILHRRHCPHLDQLIAPGGGQAAAVGVDVHAEHGLAAVLDPSRLEQAHRCGGGGSSSSSSSSSSSGTPERGRAPPHPVVLPPPSV
eukprot:scaffold521_cov308-Prasinococcus_capsulatus_cf.AAC.2